MTGEERNYPLPADNDPRFTAGLTLDLAAFLEEHGYPPATPLDLVELQQGLWSVLYTGRRR